MTTFSCSHLIAAVLGLAALRSAGEAGNPKAAAGIRPPRMAVVSMTISPGPPLAAAHAPFAAEPAAAPDAAPTKWSDIKECTFDQRAQFSAGLDRLQSRVEGQVKELKAKRAAMSSTTDTREWDFAMQEMMSAQANLKSLGDEVKKATPEFWDQLKDKVGQAWVRTQTAFASVKSSTTS
jgi:hypothetical protein